MQYLRECASKKRVGVKCRDLQSTNNLFKWKNRNENIYNVEKDRSDFNNDNTLISKLESEHPLLADVVKNALHIKKDFNDETYDLANSIRSNCTCLYKSFSKELGFPSIYKCNKHNSQSNYNFADYYMDQTKIGDIIKHWKADSNIMQHYELSACLSVDALFFNPEVEVTYENDVKGMILTDEQIS
ncbi:hypothetical protein M9Y10_004628 [Tritrichomonas musculus]|uniref:Uncharacterized protein n=1 Tax=Tritrichomonas musculus TaxID=1915356 RepID=A0ABR2JJ58_9EUKA